jgi:hypothetical protein
MPLDDIVLPSQYFQRRRGQTPEERLIIAVLHEALDCVEKHRFATDADGRRLFHEAQQWFTANETAWPTYSFECICELLDLDANAVRQRLRLVREDPLSPRATPPAYRRAGIPKPLRSGARVTLPYREPTV